MHHRPFLPCISFLTLLTLSFNRNTINKSFTCTVFSKYRLFWGGFHSRSWTYTYWHGTQFKRCHNPSTKQQSLKFFWMRAHVNATLQNTAGRNLTVEKSNWSLSTSRTRVLRETDGKRWRADLLLKQILLVEEEDDGGVGKPLIITDGVKQLQRLVHTVLWGGGGAKKCVLKDILKNVKSFKQSQTMLTGRKASNKHNADVNTNTQLLYIK